MADPLALQNASSRRTEGSLLFEYRLDEHLPLDHPTPYRHVERWVVSLLVDSPSSRDGRAEIGYAHVIVFNLERGHDIGGLADPVSGSWLDVDHIKSNPPTEEGELADDLESGPTTHVLLLDRVWLHEDYRGQGFGPIIAAAVIDRLGRGCHLAACYPAPFEASSPDDERSRSIEALSELWAKVGFRHWRDGVWMLNPQEDETRAVLVELVAARAQLSRPRRIVRPAPTSTRLSRNRDQMSGDVRDAHVR